MKRSATILFLLVLLAATVLYYLWRKSEPPAPGTAPPLVSLLPADAAYVFYADAAALRSSAYVQQVLAALPSPKEDREYADFVRRTGFDYTRDLDRLALAIVEPEPSGPSGSKPNRSSQQTVAVAFADGHFNRGRIVAYARGSGKLVRAEGPDLFFTGNGSGEQFVLTFLSENRIALAQGARPWKSRELQPREPSMLQQRIARVAASELFAVARVPRAAAKNFLPEDWLSKDIQETLAGVRWVTLAIRPEASGPGSASPTRDGLYVVVEAECESPGDARKLAWSLEGLRVLASAAGGLSDPKSMKGLDPLLAALLQIILKDGKISSADRYARLGFSLGPEFLAALAPTPGPSKQRRR